MAVKKLRVVLRWTGGTLLVLLAILALFILEENVRGHILLARYKAELRAKGEKLTMAELNLPNPTKPSDAAVVLLSSGDELREFGKSCPFSVYMIPRLQFVSTRVLSCALAPTGLGVKTRERQHHGNPYREVGGDIGQCSKRRS